MRTFTVGTRLKKSGRLQILLSLLFINALIFSLILAPVFRYASSYRAIERSPHIVETENVKTEDIKLWMEPIFSWGEKNYAGIYLFPKDSTTPIPSGLDKWIGVGEAAVSPEIAKEYPLGSESPWGKVTQIIDISSLSSSTETFFYARPLAERPAHWGYASDGFGGGLRIGEPMNALNEPHLILGFFAVFLGVPGLLLLIAGMYQMRRLREAVKVLKGLNASWWENFVFAYGNIYRVVLGAFIVSLAGVGVMSYTGLYLPLVNQGIPAADIYSVLPIYTLISLLVTLGLSVIIAGGAFASKRRKTHRRRLGDYLFSLSYVSLIPAVVASFVIAPQGLHGLSLHLTYYFTLFCYIFAIPTLVLSLIYYGVHLFNKLFGGAFSLVALGKLGHYFKTFWLSTLMFTATIMMTGAAQVYSMQLSESEAQAQIIQKSLGSNGAIIKIAALPEEELDKLIAALSSSSYVAVQGHTEKLDSKIYFPQADNPIVTKKYSSEDSRKVVEIIRSELLYISDDSGIVSNLSETEIRDRLYCVNKKFVASGKTDKADADYEAEIYRIARSYGLVTEPLGGIILGNSYTLYRYGLYFPLFGGLAIIGICIAAITMVSTRLRSAINLRQLYEIVKITKLQGYGLTLILVGIPVCLSCIGAGLGIAVLQYLIASEALGESLDISTFYYLTGLCAIGIPAGLMLLITRVKARC